MGIDKMAVAKKAGNAVVAASSSIYKAAASVDWAKVGKNIQNANK